MLYIFHNSEDGLRCDAIERDDFFRWLKEHTDGIMEKYHPRFVSQIPNEYSETNEYCMIEGRVIVPQPVTVVKTYSLD